LLQYRVVQHNLTPKKVEYLSEFKRFSLVTFCERICFFTKFGVLSFFNALYRLAAEFFKNFKKIQIQAFVSIFRLIQKFWKYLHNVTQWLVNKMQKTAFENLLNLLRFLWGEIVLNNPVYSRAIFKQYKQKLICLFWWSMWCTSLLMDHVGFKYDNGTSKD
jgi:hypothetical protein